MSINTQHLFRAKQRLNQFLHEHPVKKEKNKRFQVLKASLLLVEESLGTHDCAGCTSTRGSE